MSWSNAGVPCSPDTELCFPGGPVLVHGDEMAEIADWDADARRPRAQRDIARMTAFFWKRPTVCAFGVFTPSTGSGLFHSTADAAQCGGIKLWSDGVSEHEPWVTQYMADAREQLLEVQAGPLPDQSVKGRLAPGASHCRVEHWWPCAGERLDISALAASPEARAAAEPKREP